MGERETPRHVINVDTPAGGINTATALLLSSPIVAQSQPLQNNSSSTSSHLSAIYPSNGPAFSPIKASALPAINRLTSDRRNNNSLLFNKHPRDGIENNNHNSNNINTTSTSNSDNATTNKPSPNPSSKNNGKTSNGRKKKEAKTRNIHELRRGSFLTSSSSNINDSNSNVASSIHLWHQLRFRLRPSLINLTILRYLNRLLYRGCECKCKGHTTGKREREKYVPLSSFNEWFRPHAFRDNMALATADREQFHCKES